MSIVFLYTDPGSGALIWQLLVAAALGAAFYFRHYVGKVRALISARRNRNRELS